MTDPKPYITCEELVEFLVDYHAGDLPDDQRSEFERHLGVCPECVDYVKTYEKTVELCRDCVDPADEKAAIEQVPEDLIQAILQARKEGEEGS